MASACERIFERCQCIYVMQRHHEKMDVPVISYMPYDKCEDWQIDDMYNNTDYAPDTVWLHDSCAYDWGR